MSKEDREAWQRFQDKYVKRDKSGETELLLVVLLTVGITLFAIIWRNWIEPY